MKLFFVKWLSCFAGLVDMLIGVLTFGLYVPNLRLRVARYYARENYRRQKGNEDE